MPFRGSIGGFGYGRWQNGNATYNTVGQAQWAAMIDTTLATGNFERLYAVTHDNSNFIYVCGAINSAGGGNLVYFYDASGNTQALTSYQYGPASFPRGPVAKYSATGNIQWLTLISGSSSADQYNYDIKCDMNNNIYIVGSSVGGAVYPNDTSGTSYKTGVPNVQLVGPGTTTRASYIAKYSQDGYCQWITGIIGLVNLQSAEGYRCKVDNNNNIYFCGVYRITGSATFNVLDVSGNRQSNSLYTLPQSTYRIWQYLVKYNSEGKVQWSVYSPASIFDSNFGIATDSANNVYMGITYNSTISLFDASGFSQSNNNLEQIVAISTVSRSALVKYNSDGQAQWCTTLITDLSGNETRDVVVDSKCNVYWMGTYRSNTTTIFVSDASGTTQSNSLITLKNTATRTAVGTYLIKYNPDGKAQWATYLDQGTGTVYGLRAAVDSLNNIYITGYANSTIRVNMYDASGNTQVSSLIGFTPVAGQYESGFVVKYSSNGIAQWASYYDANSNDAGFGVDVDNANSVYSVGRNTTTTAGGITTIYNAAGNSQVVSPVTITQRSGTTGEYATIIKYR